MGVTLGQGTFGKVKLAEGRDGEQVAIKIVDKKGIADVEDVERVYRETFILTSLKHPSIIKLHQVIDTPNAILLVMEYASGGELYDRVEESGRVDEITACGLFKQIVAGVEYCHRAKIIHRDLKLENILLGDDGEIKIADFGLSNSIKFGQQLDTNCGTPSYTCPEQLRGDKYVGSSADIWSMGVILFAMVCGFMPFEAPTLPQLFRKIRHRQVSSVGENVGVVDFLQSVSLCSIIRLCCYALPQLFRRKLRHRQLESANVFFL
jgi:5'-AMP-activated protein kinase catalytic alpha subunit